MQQDAITLFSIPPTDLHTLIKKAVAEVLAENKKSNQKEILSAKELCSLLGISISTVNKWKKENRIPYSRNGKRVFFKRSEVLGALKESNYYKLKELNL